MARRLTCKWNGRIVIVDFVVLLGQSEPEHGGSVGRDRAKVSSWSPISCAIAAAITPEVSRMLGVLLWSGGSGRYA
jgi:hypothetical protein